MSDEEKMYLERLKMFALRIADPNWNRAREQEAVNDLLIHVGYAIGLCQKLETHKESLKQKLA